MPRVPCDHSGRGFRGIRQLLPCKSVATAGGFPGIPVRNSRKEREDGRTALTELIMRWEYIITGKHACEFMRKKAISPVSMKLLNFSVQFE